MNSKDINDLKVLIGTLKTELASKTQAIGENTIAYDSISKILKEQLKIQKKIFETKGEKGDGLTQQEFYKSVIKSLERIEKRVNPPSKKWFEANKDGKIVRVSN